MATEMDDEVWFVTCNGKAIQWYDKFLTARLATAGHLALCSDGLSAKDKELSFDFVQSRGVWLVKAGDVWIDHDIHVQHRSPDLEHKDNFFERLRSMLPTGLQMSGQSFAAAGLPSILSGPETNPSLKVGDKGYSVVRFAERQYSYTMVKVGMETCERCRKPTMERHTLTIEGAVRKTFGSAAMCRECDHDSWMFTCHGPRTMAAKNRNAKVVV